MNWTIYVLFVLYTAALAYGVYQRGKLEKKLEGKADKRKSGPRPNARKVEAIAIVENVPGEGDRIVAWGCSACEETVPKGGHTAKQCKGKAEA